MHTNESLNKLMPELPEVETTLQGLMPSLTGKTIHTVVLRHKQLRWPIPANLEEDLTAQVIGKLSRRAKYLLFSVGQGTLIIHLGMSGSLKIVNGDSPPTKHDHIDIVLTDNLTLRYNDPRRFGAFLWTDTDPLQHPLLRSLGPEPLSADFNASYLVNCCKNRRQAIKSLIMDSHIVVGVGNIYAAESLFLAKIHPKLPACQLSIEEAERLVLSIQQVLTAAIKQGGTTLRDFTNSQGKPGYFAQELQVYGRAGRPCTQCARPLSSIKLGQRSTVFCDLCQPLTRSPDKI